MLKSGYTPTLENSSNTRNPLFYQVPWPQKLSQAFKGAGLHKNCFYCLSRAYFPLSKHSPSLPFLCSPQSLSINAPASTSVRSPITYVSENRQFPYFCAWLIKPDAMISSYIHLTPSDSMSFFSWPNRIPRGLYTQQFWNTTPIAPVKHAGVFDSLVSFHLDTYLVFVGHSGFHEIWYNAARSTICLPACWRGEGIDQAFWWGFLLLFSAVLIIRILFLIALQTNLK